MKGFIIFLLKVILGGWLSMATFFLLYLLPLEVFLFHLTGRSPYQVLKREFHDAWDYPVKNDPSDDD